MGLGQGSRLRQMLSSGWIQAGSKMDLVWAQGPQDWAQAAHKPGHKGVHKPGHKAMQKPGHKARTGRLDSGLGLRWDSDWTKSWAQNELKTRTQLWSRERIKSTIKEIRAQMSRLDPEAKKKRNLNAKMDSLMHLKILLMENPKEGWGGACSRKLQI